MASTIRHWKRWSRIGIVSRIRSFVHRVNDQMRKKTETSFKCCRRWMKTIYVLGNVHDCNNGISSIHRVKNYLNKLSLHCECTRSHTQTNVWLMYEIGTWARWDLRIGNNWLGDTLWKYLSLIGDERVINLQRTKVYVFSDSVLCLGKIFENSQSNDAWEQKIGMVQIFFKSGKYSKDSIRCSSSKKSNVYSGERPENFKGRSYLCRCSMTFPVELKTTQQNLWQTPKSYLCIGKENDHLLVLVLSGTWSRKDSPQGIWDKIAERNLLKVDVQFSAQPMWKRLRLFFA